MDGPEEEAEVQRISDALWGPGPSGVKQTGKGRVYWGKSFKEVMAAEQIEPDVTFPKGLNLSWIHRKIGDADVYFLYSGSERELGVSVSFRMQDKVPEIWDPMTGEQRPAEVWNQDGKRTNVALRFDPNGSAVVVFSPGKSRTLLSPNSRMTAKWFWTVIRRWFDSPHGCEAIKQAYDSERDGEGRGQFLGPVQKAAAEIDGDTLTAWKPGSFVLEMSDGKTRKDRGRQSPLRSRWMDPGRFPLSPAGIRRIRSNSKELKPLSEHAE